MEEIFQKLTEGEIVVFNNLSKVDYKFDFLKGEEIPFLEMLNYFQPDNVKVTDRMEFSPINNVKDENKWVESSYFEWTGTKWFQTPYPKGSMYVDGTEWGIMDETVRADYFEDRQPKIIRVEYMLDNFGYPSFTEVTYSKTGVFSDKEVAELNKYQVQG